MRNTRQSANSVIKNGYNISLIVFIVEHISEFYGYMILFVYYFICFCFYKKLHYCLIDKIPSIISKQCKLIPMCYIDL